ncbi:uncharacterized protein FFFS_16048 [Fusarium fujikuroi]|nr:uncharacterized protein FFFS_16048 [Fusarium fujikuroi]
MVTRPKRYINEDNILGLKQQRNYSLGDK